MRKGTFASVRAVMVERASRYERLALRARSDPFLAKTGYAVATFFMILGMLDSVSTNWALSVGAIEINGFMRTLQETLGELWFVPKLLLQAMVASMIVWSPNKPTILIMMISCCWTASVVVNNFVIAYALS